MNRLQITKAIKVVAFCFFSIVAVAQNKTEWDLDGDGVHNATDMYPYEYGPESNKGCPDS